MFNKVDSARFRDIVSKGNVFAVLNGHLHFPLFTVVDGIHYVQAGSPLWENSYSVKGMPTTDSSGFNLLSYNVDSEDKPAHLLNRLFVKPVSFSKGTLLIEKTP